RNRDFPQCNQVSRRTKLRHSQRTNSDASSSFCLTAHRGLGAMQIIESVAHRAGKSWLTGVAEIAERYLLRDFAIGVEWSVLLARESGSACEAAETVCWRLYPELEGDRKFAAVFWDLQVGERHPDAATVKEFVEGAWEAFAVAR